MKRSILTTCFLILLVWLGSCTDDATIPSPVGPDDKGDPEGNVRVKINVPSARNVTTYSLTELEECEIESIDVLVFDNTAANRHKFLYHETGVDITEVDGEDTQRRFSMKIRQTSNPDNVYLMIFANIDDTMEQLLGTEINEGDSREDIINKLVYQLPYDETTAQEGGKWLVKPGRYTRFPMWGVSEPVDLTQETITVNAVSLLRSPAKIDIGLNFDASDVAQGLDDFFLEEFYLFNAYSSLMIAPYPANYDEGTARVTAESLPPGVTTFDPNEPIKYFRRLYRGDQGYKDFLNEIYLAEHPKGADDNIDPEARKNNVAIVVGGRWGTLNDDITYYRIDLVKQVKNAEGTVTKTEWLPVLRNHRYRINITKVLNRGYYTVEEAFSAMGLNTNLEIDIVDEDENITENVYDGQYRLGVDKTNFLIDKNGFQSASHPKQIYVSTNYEGGWKATADVDWITFVQDDGVTVENTKEGPTGVSYLKYLVGENTTTRERTGKITIVAGRLDMVITVTQSQTADIEITDVLACYIMDGTSRFFRVKSTYDWSVRVIDDLYNIVASYDKKGEASPSTAQVFYFAGINEVLMDALPVDQKTRHVTFEFYSPKDEFEPFRQEVRMSRYIDIDELDFCIYGINITPGQLWSVAANVTASTTIVEALPGAQYQSNPPQEYSCAAIEGHGSGYWHLPTTAQIEEIFNSVIRTNYTQYNFDTNYLWSATSVSGTNAYRWRPYTAASSVAKTGTLLSRCVISKENL